MAHVISLHPVSPQPRLVAQVVSDLRDGKVIAYPTSSGYALGAAISNPKGATLIREIRQLQDKQDFTLMCASISNASNYAKIDNNNFALLKRLDMEKYTFLLKATGELTKKAHSKRGTVGIRIANSKTVLAVLEELGEPLISASLLKPDADDIDKGKKIHEGYTRGLELEPFNDAWEVKDALEYQVEAVIDVSENIAAYNTVQPTTVLDLTDSEPVLIRLGQGEWGE